MIQRQRIYELILGDLKTGDAVRISELTISFDVNKSVDNKRKSNGAIIEVTNLSNATLAKLETEFLAASLSVGFVDTGLVALLIGQVTQVTTVKRGADKVTQLQLGEGYIELTQQYIKSVTPEGSTVEEVVEEVRKQMPGVVRGAYSGLNLQNRVMFGYPLTGTPRQILNDLAETYRFEYRLDRNALSVNDLGGVSDKDTSTAFVLNERTGLVDIPYKTSADGRKAKKDNTKRMGVQVKALLNARILPGSPIRIESELITGWYRVVDARYYGDSSGNDWYVEAFCEEILTGDIAK